MFARASDIPEFVNDGVADMGITGVDLIKESESDVSELLDLRFGQTKLVFASPEESDINSIKDIKEGMKVATEFPVLTRKYLNEKGLDLKIVKLSGSTEAAPFIGIADLITDLTSTGTTLPRGSAARCPPAGPVYKVLIDSLDIAIKIILISNAV